jgi:hypothetical protein
MTARLSLAMSARLPLATRGLQDQVSDFPRVGRPWPSVLVTSVILGSGRETGR